MGLHEEVQTLVPQLIAWRRDFHRHPEIGLDLPRSAGIIAGVLRTLEYEVAEHIARSGVVGVLRNGEGPVVMVRADMDALPIQEENDVPYASVEAGVMHACGHDGHMAIGLAVATLMAQTREQWRGTLKMVFQPGEEGFNGAEIMMAEGVLENPRPDCVLALHLWSTLTTGKVAVTPGPVMASAEAWRVTVTGQGGHAAQPDRTVDPVVTAALIVTALQTIVSRNVSPLETAVVTVGRIAGGDAFNVIPDQVILEGTIRTYDPLVRETVLQRFREIVAGTAALMGANATLDLHAMTPALVNDETITREVQDVVRKTQGDEALELGLRTMGSEDAAFFLQEAPGCYVFVGATSPGKIMTPHHNPHFDLDEEALVIGTSLLLAALRHFMAFGRED
ncbi:MAG: amidohydrolase [Anaerolineae bacterium]|nr:amidohydrolase [Anaerolineae bacterium]